MESLRHLSKKEFKRLVIGLMTDLTLYGPVVKDGFPAYDQITSFSKLKLFQTPTHLSAKEFVFPQRETLLKFDRVKNTHEEVVRSEDQAIIGLHSCDIHAMNLTDRVFSYGTSDKNYLTRRKKTLIIGTECMPDEYCFCRSVETMEVDEGFDLFLHEIKAGFLVRTGSKKGEKTLKKYTRTRKAKAAELKEFEYFRSKKVSSFTARLEAEASALPLIYAGSYNSPVWEKIGKICYGCGSCNHVCPTCYCFDVKDDVTMDLKKGERYRVWDGCCQEDFAKVAGGHNFRKSRAERLRHRFNRKFQYQRERFGGLFCVGCGRCSRTCLVNINIVEVTNELIRESEETTSE